MSTPRRANTVTHTGLAMAIGFGWYLVEGLAGVTEDVDRGELAARWLRYLPWHLLAFGILGVCISIANRLKPLTRAGSGWFVVSAASFLFLGARLAEGTLHAYPLPVAALRVTLLAIAIAALAGAIAAGVRTFPARFQASGHSAALVFWSLLFILFLRRAGASVGLGELDVAVALDHLHGIDLGVAGLGALLAATSRIRRSGAALALTLAVAGALSWTQLEMARAAGSPGDRGDVIVILLDTLRGDHLVADAEGSGRTPHLAAWAPEFFRFSRAYSPSTRTSRSMPGIMTSLSIDVTGAILPEEAVTLAERLQEAGWSTSGISANPLVSAQFGYDQGFDVLTGLADSPEFLIVAVLKLASAALPGTTYRLGIADADLYYPRIGRLRERAMRIFDRAEAPGLLYLQTMDAHGPYLPPHPFLPDGYRAGNFLSYFRLLRLSGTPQLAQPDMQPRLENVRERYAGEVRYTDIELAKLFEDLKSRGRWDEATVWILSDHGEAFGEHGFAGHGQPYVGLPIVRVPLWLKPPRSLELPPRELDATVSTFDVLPTTLALLGLEPLDVGFGKDLTPLLAGAQGPRDRIVVSETDMVRGRLRSATQGRWKLDLYSPKDEPWHRVLFDLEADPGETRDVAAAHPEIAETLERAIVRRIEQAGQLAFKRRKRQVDPQMRERLRALGYVDD